MINILIVEDDKNIRKLMSIWLQKAGYNHTCSHNTQRSQGC